MVLRASISTSPFSWAVRHMSLACLALEAKGFSQSTCFPWESRSIVCAKCSELGEAMYAASKVSLQAACSRSVKVCSTPWRAAKAEAVSCRRE